MTASFESPLHKGQLVETVDGFLVEISAEPLHLEKGYRVTLTIVDAPLLYQSNIGDVKVWGHCAPGCFVGSKILRIDGERSPVLYSLEEEYFNRERA
jgi:hypothetical protein